MVPPSDPPFLAVVHQVPEQCQASRNIMGATNPPPPWTPSSFEGLTTLESLIKSASSSRICFQSGELGPKPSSATETVPAPPMPTRAFVAYLGKNL